MLKFNSFLIYYNMKIYRYIINKQLPTSDFCFYIFSRFPQEKNKFMFKIFKTLQPMISFTRLLFLCLSYLVNNTICHQSQPNHLQLLTGHVCVYLLSLHYKVAQMQNINLLFKCFKANYKKSYFCNVACWLKIKKTERHFLRHVAATIM